MTYKEFSEWAEGEGYGVEDIGSYIRVQRGRPLVGTIEKEFSCEMNTNYSAFEDMTDTKREELLSKMFELAKTPLEDREEPKRFRLMHKWLKKGTGYNYLNYGIDTGEFFLSGPLSNKWHKTIFAQKEIEEIKKIQNTDLSDFDLFEVENDL